MKYPKLKDLVPANEQFDETAVGEGVWLSTGHIDNIEKSLTGSGETIAEKEATIAEQTATIETLTDAVATEKQNAENITEAAATAAAISAEKVKMLEAAATASAEKIKDLEAQVAELGKDSSGTGSALITNKDETVENPNHKPGLLDADHPINQYAAMQIEARKKPKL